MTWDLVEQTGTSAEGIYEILKHHRLLPASLELAASVCTSMATGGSHFIIYDGADEVANVFISGVVEGESAQLDLVPVTRYFRTGFDDQFMEAMQPLLELLFSTFMVRRITAAFPATRSRTKRALCSLGFKPEGRIREGVALYNRAPEDIRILGLLRQDYLQETEPSEAGIRPDEPEGLASDYSDDHRLHSRFGGPGGETSSYGSQISAE